MPSATLTAAKTAFISPALPTNNFSEHPLLYVGTDPGLQNCIGFLKFDMPALPAASVDRAYLQLTVMGKTGAAPSPVTVGSVSSALDIGTVTYAARPGFDAAPGQVNVTAANLYKAVQFDVTRLVNGWLGGASVNSGFVLQNSDGTTLVQFAAAGGIYEPVLPRLVLHYAAAPQSQANANISLSNTNAQTVAPSLVPTAAPTVAPTLIPTAAPTVAPALVPTAVPTVAPSLEPVLAPTLIPDLEPTLIPTVIPSVVPTFSPSLVPTFSPSLNITTAPANAPGLSNTNALMPSAGSGPMNAAQLTPEMITALSLGFSAGMNSRGAPMPGGALPPVILINSNGAGVSFSKHDSLSNVLVINIIKSELPGNGIRRFEDDT